VSEDLLSVELQIPPFMSADWRHLAQPLGLYKILFTFEACVHESIIFLAHTTFVWVPHFHPSSHTLLRNILFPLDHPLLKYIPYTFGTSNIV